MEALNLPIPTLICPGRTLCSTVLLVASLVAASRGCNDSGALVLAHLVVPQCNQKVELGSVAAVWVVLPPAPRGHHAEPLTAGSLFHRPTVARQPGHNDLP